MSSVLDFFRAKKIKDEKKLEATLANIRDFQEVLLKKAERVTREANQPAHMVGVNYMRAVYDFLVREVKYDYDGQERIAKQSAGVLDNDRNQKILEKNGMVVSNIFNPQYGQRLGNCLTMSMAHALMLNVNELQQEDLPVLRRLRAYLCDSYGDEKHLDCRDKSGFINGLAYGVVKEVNGGIKYGHMINYFRSKYEVEPNQQTQHLFTDISNAVGIYYYDGGVDYSLFSKELPNLQRNTARLFNDQFIPYQIYQFKEDFKQKDALKFFEHDLFTSRDHSQYYDKVIDQVIKK